MLTSSLSSSSLNPLPPLTVNLHHHPHWHLERPLLPFSPPPIQLFPQGKAAENRLSSYRTVYPEEMEKSRQITCLTNYNLPNSSVGPLVI